MRIGVYFFLFFPTVILQSVFIEEPNDVSSLLTGKPERVISVSEAESEGFVKVAVSVLESPKIIRKVDDKDFKVSSDCEDIEIFAVGYTEYILILEFRNESCLLLG